MLSDEGLQTLAIDWFFTRTQYSVDVASGGGRYLNLYQSHLKTMRCSPDF
jgi:hypothetical protein